MDVTPFQKGSRFKIYKDTIYDVKKIEEQGNWYIITTDEGEVEWIDSDEYQLVIWNSEDKEAGIWGEVFILQKKKYLR